MWKTCSKLFRRQECAAAFLGNPDKLLSIERVVGECARAYCPDLPDARRLVACSSSEPMAPRELGIAWAQLMAEIVALDHGPQGKSRAAQALQSAFQVELRIPPPTPPRATPGDEQN